MHANFKKTVFNTFVQRTLSLGWNQNLRLPPPWWMNPTTPISSICIQLPSRMIETRTRWTYRKSGIPCQRDHSKISLNSKYPTKQKKAQQQSNADFISVGSHYFTLMSAEAIWPDPNRNNQNAPVRIQQRVLTSLLGTTFTKKRLCRCPQQQPHPELPPPKLGDPASRWFPAKAIPGSTIDAVAAPPSEVLLQRAEPGL